jgi:hypothetical protein
VLVGADVERSVIAIAFVGLGKDKKPEVAVDGERRAKLKLVAR